MVAVGDEDGPLAHQALHLRMRLLVVNRPELVDNAQVIDCLERGPIAQTRLGGEDDLGMWIGIEPEDGTQVEFRRLEKSEAIGLGAGERLLVREDLSLAEGLEADAGQKALSGIGPAFDLERLVVEIQGRVIVLAEDAGSTPVPEEPGRSGVSIVLGVVAGLFLIQFQTDDVVRTRLVEAVLESGIDDIVGGSHHVGQRTDLGHVVPDSLEGADIGHGCGLLEGGSRI